MRARCRGMCVLCAYVCVRARARARVCVVCGYLCNKPREFGLRLDCQRVTLLPSTVPARVARRPVTVSAGQVVAGGQCAFAGLSASLLSRRRRLCAAAPRSDRGRLL